MDIARMDVAQAARTQYENLSVRTPNIENITDEQKLREACRDFESIFVKQLLDGMRKTIQKSDLLNGGLTEEIYEDMLYTEYAKDISRNSSLGLAELLYNQLKPRDAGVFEA
jgi:flagellar protein FlgJ